MHYKKHNLLLAGSTHRQNPTDVLGHKMANKWLTLMEL